MNDDYVTQTRPAMLRSWILSQMLTGAGWAALPLIGVMLFIYVIYLIGLLLPEESRQTPDPMPRSSIEWLMEPGNPTV
ncbi:MAG: RC-LH1 core complex protein PufX [Gemmobacter sp.]